MAALRISGLEKRIQTLYKEKGIDSPSKITLSVFDEWLNVHVIHRSGGTNNIEFNSAYHVFIDQSKVLLDRRIEMAHEIGHMLLHVGNQLWLKEEIRAKQEWQADRFAMYALVPSIMLVNSIRKNICDKPFIAELAFEYGVTYRFMNDRIKLLREETHP